MARFRKADRPYTYSLSTNQNRGIFRQQMQMDKPGQMTQPVRQARQMGQLEERRPSYFMRNKEQFPTSGGVPIRVMKPMGTVDTSRQVGFSTAKTFQSKKEALSARNQDLAITKKQYGMTNRFRRGGK